jgi:ABC-type spermidine/putrescine transport system permease subunit I
VVVIAPGEAPPPPTVKTPRRSRRTSGTGVWAWFAAPGTLWLLLLFVVPFYAVMAIAFGGVDPIFRSARPEWNPLQWNFSSMNDVLGRVFGGDLGGVFIRTFWYVGVTLLLCTLIGYPIAYYVARRARRSRGLLLVLIVIPFWISYLMRMLAWSSLLELDGWVNRILVFFHILDEPRNWLAGEPSTVILGLTYGYVPFFILPLYASLERLDERLLEAGRDLGASRTQTFLRITLPLSLPGLLAAMVITALPMFGDYYTNGYLSGSPRTEMIGNQIEFYLRGTSQPQVGAALVLILSALLLVLMAYYLVTTNRAQRELSR